MSTWSQPTGCGTCTFLYTYIVPPSSVKVYTPICPCMCIGISIFTYVISTCVYTRGTLYTVCVYMYACHFTCWSHLHVNWTLINSISIQPLPALESLFPLYTVKVYMHVMLAYRAQSCYVCYKRPFFCTVTSEDCCSLAFNSLTYGVGSHQPAPK